MMRYSLVLLLCSLLVACGKTGALYLPEEEPEAVPQQQQPTPAEDAKDSGNTD